MDMNRILRHIWVVAANGFVVCVTISRYSGTFSSRDFRDPEMWVEFLLELLLPILGIVLEISNRKSANWVNIGSLTLGGAFWLAEAVWWRSDPFFGVLLIISFGLFILAGLTALIYWATKAQGDRRRQTTFR
jgi:hypothetical protein